METSDVTAFILAGGKSSRFGSDKTVYCLEGTELIDRVITVVQTVAGSVAIITDGTRRFHRAGVEEFGDIVPRLGPIGGILTALERLETRRAIVLACDMPFLNRELLRHMIELSDGFDVVVPRIKGMFEPLHAVYSRNCLEAVRNAIDKGQRQIVAFYENVSVRALEEREIAEFIDPATAFVNINHADDVAVAKTILGKVNET